MTYREFVKRVTTIIALVTATVLLLLGIQRIIPLLSVIFTAWVIAVTLEVPVRLLQQRIGKRIPAVLITVALLLIVGGLFFALVIPAFVQQTADLIQNLPEAIRAGIENYDKLRASRQMLENLLPPFTVEDFEAFLAGQTELFPEAQPLDQAPIDLAGLLSTALPVLGQIGTFFADTLSNLFLVLLLALLLLIEPTMFYTMFVVLVPREKERRAVEIIDMARRRVTKWLGSMLISMAATTVLFLLVLGAILGLPNALALSLLAGAATIVPTFGPTIALLPVILVAAPQGLNRLLLTVILYAAVGVVQDRLITPAIMKSALKIPAAGLVISQLILTIAIGPVGLLLAFPILAILVTLARELYIFDVLKKKGAVPRVEIQPDGRLCIEHASAQQAPKIETDVCKE